MKKTKKDQLNSISEIMGKSKKDGFELYFGKYKGFDISSVSDNYLIWLVENVESEIVIEKANEEIKKRNV